MAAPAGTTFGSGFNFGTGAFPAIPAATLGGGFGGFGAGAAGAVAGKAEDGEAGEEGGDREGGEGEGNGEGVQLFGNAVVQPVVSLPEQEARTGEEEEKVLFSGGCAWRVFRICLKHGCVGEAGVGVSNSPWA